LPERVADIQKRIKFIVHRMGKTPIRESRIRGKRVFTPTKSEKEAGKSAGSFREKIQSGRHVRRAWLQKDDIEDVGGALDRRPDDVNQGKKKSTSFCASKKNCTSG